MIRLELDAQVSRGLVRAINQDVARGAVELRLALVADGMGGHERGEVASAVAADALEEAFSAFGAHDRDVSAITERMHHGFSEASKSVAGERAAAGWEPIGTTLVAAVFGADTVVIGNVGDSRCYRLRNATLEVLTHDHSYAALLREIGRSEGRGDRDRRSHVLTRCINGDLSVVADIRIVDCEPGDRFLLCSDGLWGYVPSEVIAHQLQSAPSPEQACTSLIAAACAVGGSDNIAVAVVHVAFGASQS